MWDMVMTERESELAQCVDDLVAVTLVLQEWNEPDLAKQLTEITSSIHEAINTRVPCAP